MSSTISLSQARLFCLALTSVVTACGSLEPMEVPKPQTEIDARPGLVSGRDGEFLLYGSAPDDETRSVDVFGSRQR
jgi:hypothetical protein